MHADFAPRHADAPGPRLPGVVQLPNRPRQQPINWQYQAQKFDRFVGDHANGVMYRVPGAAWRLPHARRPSVFAICPQPTS